MALDRLRGHVAEQAGPDVARCSTWQPLIVLIIDPSAAMNAGFQLSFAATAALVSVYEALRRRAHLNGKQDTSWFRAAWFRPIRFIGALALTSLIAGIATGPIAAFHFNHVASYGLAGNVHGHAGSDHCDNATGRCDVDPHAVRARTSEPDAHGVFD
jgi:hypothetical protein